MTDKRTIFEKFLDRQIAKAAQRAEDRSGSPEGDAAEQEFRELCKQQMLETNEDEP